jgi:hypothetical protein
VVGQPLGNAARLDSRVREVSTPDENRRAGEHERRLLIRGRSKGIEPSLERFDPSHNEKRGGSAGSNLGGPFHVAVLERELDSVFAAPAFHRSRHRTGGELSRLLGRLRLELAPQKLANEQMEPETAVRRLEQTLCSETLEHVVSVGETEELARERGIDGRRDRGEEHEALHFGRFASQHLLGEIPVQRVRYRDVGHVRRGRQRGEPNDGRPPACPEDRPASAVGRQISQDFTRFVVRHRQEVGSDLRDLAVEHHPRRCPSGLDPRGDEEADRRDRKQPVNELLHGARLLDHVVVIDDEQAVRRPAGEIDCEQLGERSGVVFGHVTRAEVLTKAVARIGDDAPNRGGDPRGECRKVGRRGRRPVPRDVRSALHPFRGEHRLAVARRRPNDDRLRRDGVEQARQPWPGDVVAKQAAIAGFSGRLQELPPPSRPSLSRERRREKRRCAITRAGDRSDSNSWEGPGSL